MAWESFAVREMDPLTMLGFELVGDLVRRRRQRFAISQRQLEHLSGVDQTVISRLENGKLRGLRWSRFADLVGALGESDPPPRWTRRFMPPGRDGIPA
jgi:predicted transcriptional regulator